MVKQLKSLTFVNDNISNTYQVSSDTNPDWNQNDETAADYVKNRTHWIEFNENKILLNSTIDLSESSSVDFSVTQAEIFHKAHPTLMYTTYINDVEISSGNFTVPTDLTRTALVYNIYADAGVLSENKHTFMIMWNGNTSTYTLAQFPPVYNGIFTLRIETTQDIIHTLSDEYLPHGLGSANPDNLSGWQFNRLSNNVAGNGSVAGGFNSQATGATSLALGNQTEATGYASQAFGNSTKATAQHAMAYGCMTEAIGQASKASGYCTKAQGCSQEVSGEYNIIDNTATQASKRGKYLQIVGNGTSDTARSNAHTLDWEGNAWFAGKIYAGGTGQDDENAVEVATLAKAEDWIFTLEDGSTVTKKVVLG